MGLYKRLTGMDYVTAPLNHSSSKYSRHSTTERVTDDMEFEVDIGITRSSRPRSRSPVLCQRRQRSDSPCPYRQCYRSRSPTQQIRFSPRITFIRRDFADQTLEPISTRAHPRGTREKERPRSHLNNMYTNGSRTCTYSTSEAVEAMSRLTLHPTQSEI